jgi:hypothetical protein
MSERPWWFPTAVQALLAAWAVTTLSFAVTEAARNAWYTCASTAFWGVVSILLARRLAAAEDAYRDRVRPPSLDRWGGDLAASEVSAMRLSGPVFAIAALSAALAAGFALARQFGGVFGPIALVAILGGASIVSARWGNPIDHTIQVWWPAVKHRWRTTLVLLSAFLLGDLWLTTFVMLAQRTLGWWDLFLPVVSVIAVWRIRPYLRDSRPTVAA